MRATSPEDLLRLGPEWAAWAAAAAGGGNASYAGLPEPGAPIASRTQWIQGRAPTRVKWVEDGGAAYIVREEGGGRQGGGCNLTIFTSSPPAASPASADFAGRRVEQPPVGEPSVRQWQQGQLSRRLRVAPPLPAPLPERRSTSPAAPSKCSRPRCGGREGLGAPHAACPHCPPATHTRAR